MEIITDLKTVSLIQKYYENNNIIEGGFFKLYLKLEEPSFKFLHQEFPFVKKIANSLKVASLSESLRFFDSFLGEKRFHFYNTTDKIKGNLKNKGAIVWFEGCYFIIFDDRQYLIQQSILSEIDLIRVFCRINYYFLFHNFKFHIENNFNLKEVIEFGDEIGFSQKLIKDKLDIF